MIRDSYSNALLETDVLELQKYRREKNRDKEVAQLKRDILTIKEAINNLAQTLNRIENRHG